MKNYASNKILKKIALILTIIMVFNFAVPNFSRADDNDGGDLFTPVSSLLKTVSDLIIKGLQKIFTGDGQIKITDTITTTVYQNNYDTQKQEFITAARKTTSLDDLLALEIPIDDEGNTKVLSELDGAKERVESLLKLEYNDTGRIKFPSPSTVSWTDYISDPDKVTDAVLGTIFLIARPNLNDNIVTDIADIKTTYSIKYGPGVIFSGTLPVFDINFINPIKTEEIIESSENNEESELKLSSAAVLRNVISRWYQDLQKVALVGLLSVLVYVAIRMIISSTGQDKAKYKKMLMDWLVAMCIIFMLHYVMLFVLNITNSINEVFSSNAIGENGEDKLMSYMRNQIGSENNYLEVFANIIMYIALVIFTLMFTIQYLKRVVYMAFLTMIAPLIALTYPLDKIKDGQAQAFSMWIREYIFNALIQSIHLMLYVVLVGSAIDLMEEYPLLAVITVGFLVPGEKFFRDMFGFNKADSVSTLGSVAGGAAVMSMINNIKGGKGSKQKNEGKEEKSGIERIRTKNPLGALQNSNNIDSENINSAITGIHQETQNESNLQENIKQENEEKIVANAVKERIEQGERTRAQRRRDGIKQVLKGKPKSFTKKAIRFAGKTAGGVAFGTIGLAAGVTTGDFKKALGYAAGGATAGAAVGGRLANGAMNAPKNIEEAFHGIQDTYREGAYDRETAQNMRFDSEFLSSENGKELAKKYSEEDVRQCLEAGVTDSSKIDKILKYSTTNGNVSVSEAIAYNHLAQNCPDSILNGKPSDLQRYLSLRDININENRANEIQKIMNSLK